MRGAYLFVTRLHRDKGMNIGRLGTFQMKEGYYCYVGSADGENVSIESRTGRHLRLIDNKEGSLRWHIDYFLVDLMVSLVGVKKFRGRDECELSKIIEESADSTIKGFGSSDCSSGCSGHFHYFKEKPDFDSLIEKSEGGVLK